MIGQTLISHYRITDALGVLAALDHPGIVAVYSVEEAQGVHFLTMQLVGGRSLDQLIETGGLPVERILSIATPLAEALAAAHAKGIVHRDVKPANVTVSDDGRVKARDQDSGLDAAPSESSPSIAVLPFDNLSGDPDQEYFSDGMAEEVLNALSSVAGVRVAARTSAFSFKGKDVDVREVAEKLDVNHVLEGGVRRSGSRLRINAQLVSAEDGYQLWSDVFDREMTDVFEVQEEIAQAIVGALRSQFDLAREVSSLVRPGTENLEASARGKHQRGPRGL